MDIQSLVGLTLESCRFSKSSYTFEFSGLLDGGHVTLLVSTAFSVSAVGGAKVDACAEFSKLVWSLLERQVIHVETDAKTFEARFEFGEDSGFTVWSDGPPIDNLLLVRDSDSGRWFPVL